MYNYILSEKYLVVGLRKWITIKLCIQMFTASNLKFIRKWEKIVNEILFGVKIVTTRGTAIMLIIKRKHIAIYAVH